MRIPSTVKATVTVVVAFSLGFGVSYLLPNDDNRVNTDIPGATGPIRDLNEDPYVLDISNQGLDNLPEWVYEQPNITHLVIANNEFVSLPSQISQFNSLRVLDVSNNKLEGALPAEISQMKLEDLNASNNLLSGIPAEIGQLTELRFADFSQNNISTYPNELTNLEQLKWLDLSDNPFSQETIDEIQDLIPATIVNY